MPTKKAHAQLRSTFIAWGFIFAGWATQPWPPIAATCFAAGFTLCVALFISDARHARAIERAEPVTPHPRRTPTHPRPGHRRGCGVTGEQIPADEVLPGDEILAEDTWAQVRAANIYDGWVSIVVAGMDLRYTIGEPVWVQR
jgi:hypothetical protein